MSTSLGMVPGMGNPRLELAPMGRLLPIIQTATVFVGSHPFSSGKRAVKSVANADTVIASDETYGRKEIISVNSRVYDYLLTSVREPQILRDLREETATMRGSQMQVSPDQAQLLAMLVQILGAERCIEVGVYTVLSGNSFSALRLGLTSEKTLTGILRQLIRLKRVLLGDVLQECKGYSSLAIALVLPKGGRLVACERDAKSLEVAKRYYDLAGVSKKVDVKHGLAADTLKSMIQNGEGGSYDFAFVDADKKMYQDYFELLLQLVRVGGIIVMDNVLWHGKVADPLVNDSKTVSIRNFNNILMMDERVSISMVPIGDGMTICRKR